MDDHQRPGGTPHTVRGSAPDVPEEPMARRLKALGDPTRLRILSLLAANPDRDVCVCDFVEPLGVSQPTVSHHLKVLAGEGFLHREKRGTWVYYRLADPSLPATLAALAGIGRPN